MAILHEKLYAVSVICLDTIMTLYTLTQISRLAYLYKTSVASTE